MGGLDNFYNDLAQDPNNFSYWFPKVKDCGLPVPESTIIPVPQYMLDHFFMEHPECDGQSIYNWVKKEVYPKKPNGLVFVKNGTFSNKYDFRDCAPTSSIAALTASITNIQYMSFVYDAGGNTEIILRERIGLRDADDHYKIYGGMPLRPEFRVFYDFTNHKALYVVNYWDWSYCHDAIARNRTDALVYETAYPEIEDFYRRHADMVMELVENHMKNVTELEGIWSVDIMFCEDKFWLIDMAVGHRSAYYDPARIKETEPCAACRL